MCEPFGDRRLADTCLADKDGVIFRAAREDLYHAGDFAVSPDDRIELVLARAISERAREARERARLFRLVSVTDLSFLDVRKHARKRGTIYPETRDHVRCGSRDFYDAEEQMLGGYELVIETRGDTRRRLENLHKFGREIELEAGRHGIAAAAFDLLEHRIRQMRDINIKLFEHRKHH